MRNEPPLMILKEVAGQLGRPAHRIIHLCEGGVVAPAWNAAGRGSVRRFNPEDVFRLAVALELQEAGVRVPLIKPLMRALDHFLGVYGVQQVRGKARAFGLAGAIRAASSAGRAVHAYLRPPNRVALVVPGHANNSQAAPGIWLYAEESQIPRWKVAVRIDLTAIAAEF